MIAYTVLLLFIIGALGSIRVGVKTDKILSFVVFASIFFTFLQFYQAMSDGVTHTFSFMWNTSQGQDLKFEIISNSYNYMLVFPCFIVTVLAVLNNFLFRYEERRAAYSAVLIFNLTALILLLTSNNFVQLISALFVTDILALFMIKDAQACRRYSMLNMMADMVLFSVSAIINARVDSLDLQQIQLYQQTALYPDFTSLLGLTAIFAKLGFFMFQIGVIGLKNIRFHRIQNLLFLSSPFAALILLLKFNALWRISDYFTFYLDIMCVATGLWAFVCGIYANDFKAKMICLMLLFWALMVALLRCYGFAWIPEFSQLIIEMYVLVTAFYLIYFYNNRCRMMTQMMQLRLTHKKRLASTLGIIVLTEMAATHTLSVMYNNINRFYIIGFSALFLLVVSVIIGQIYFGDGKRNVGIQHDIVFKWGVFAELTALCGWLLQSAADGGYIIWGSAVVFIGLLICSPLWKLQVFYKMEGLQHCDFWGSFYQSIVRVFRMVGRVLAVLVDFVFLERILLVFAQSVSISGLRLFRRLHANKIGGTVAVFMVLGVLLWYTYRSSGGQ
ncbi:MAG: hypothetical protein IJ770_05350 [Alphaproteobacteria bacterium]|nr:hypothetical protein [Alphaproteobacteria bacterium]